MVESNELKKNASPIKIIAIKFGYVLGLFTVIYLVALAYTLIFGFDPASRYSALIILALAVGITAIDLTMLMCDKVSPALIAMVLWLSPFYMLYKLFKHGELFNLNSTHLAKKVKQYLTTPFLSKSTLIRMNV